MISETSVHIYQITQYLTAKVYKILNFTLIIPKCLKYEVKVKDHNSQTQQYFIAFLIPYVLESNPHHFYSLRGLKNQMRIRFAVVNWILEKR